MLRGFRRKANPKLKKVYVMLWYAQTSTESIGEDGGTGSSYCFLMIPSIPTHTFRGPRLLTCYARGDCRISDVWEVVLWPPIYSFGVISLDQYPPFITACVQSPHLVS